MHDTNAEGNEFFKCDFCHSPWAEDRPMVEGHQGSLICSRCLSAAYVEVVHMAGGVKRLGAKCVMCLEERQEPQWQSPLVETAFICKRCVKQSTGTLEHDEESGWKRPAPPAGARAVPDEPEGE